MVPPLASKEPWCTPGRFSPQRVFTGAWCGCDSRCAVTNPVNPCRSARGIRHPHPSLQCVQQAVDADDAVPQAVTTGIAPGSVLGARRGHHAGGRRRPVGGPDTNCCRRRNRWLPRSASSGRARHCCDSVPCQLPLVAQPWTGPSGTAGRSVMVRTTPTPGQDPDRSLRDRLAAKWWSRGFRHALPGRVPVRRWTGAHDEHP